jgi:Ca-activated chloride channel family protein
LLQKAGNSGIPWRRAVCIALLTCSVICAAASGQQGETSFRADVALVNVLATVVDRNNRFVPGLKAEDFNVLEDRQPQSVEYFSELSANGDDPLTIALLVDTSFSVRDKLQEEKQAAADFVRAVLRQENDSAFLMQFDSEIKLVQDFTRDPREVVRALNQLEAASSTALYDAISLAVNEKLARRPGRKVIVVISDGEDTSSRISKDDSIRVAQQNDVVIYGMGVRGELGADFSVLKAFAKETGGRFFSPRARVAEMETAFRSINEELRAQYSLAYTSKNTRRDGAYRMLQVACRVGGVKVRTRKGYYAPTQ